MERLTIKNSDGSYSQPTHATFEKLFYKVADLEDIMEKCNIESMKELEDRLKRAIEFSTPHIERFAVVQYVYRNNKPYKIVNCYDSCRDKDYNIKYAFYNIDSMNFKLIGVFATKEEAEKKLEELKSERR